MPGPIRAGYPTSTVVAATRCREHTIKFTLTHVFPCTPAEFFALHDDPDFEAMQSSVSKVQRTRLELVERPDGTRRKVVRCRPDRDVPRVLKPFVGPDGIVYHQINETDPAKGTLKWSIEIQGLSDRVTLGGDTLVVAHPDGCERTMSGEVKVNVRFVGGKIEQYVGDQIKSGYDKTARAIVAFIEDRKAT